MATLDGSTYLAVTTSSQNMLQLAQGHQYRFCATVDCYVTVGATGGAAAASNGSHLIKAGQAVGFTAKHGDATNSFFHVIGLAAGAATMSRVA